MTDPDRELDRWRSLFKTFSLQRRSDVPIPPTGADLDRFEAETGIRLPAGFRSYLRVFGPGCLLVGGGRDCREMFISSPYCPDSSLNLGRGVDLLRSLRDDPPRGMDERVRRLVVFARNGLGHEFGWDPQEPCYSGRVYRASIRLRISLRVSAGYRSRRCSIRSAWSARYLSLIAWRNQRE